MPRHITHNFLNVTVDQSPAESGRFAEQRFPIRINRVGRLEIGVTVQHVSKPLPVPDTGQPLPHTDGPPGGGQILPDAPPGGNKPKVTAKPLPYTVVDPAGNPFSRSEVTLADLDRFRDLRGFAAMWTLVIHAFSYTNTEFDFISGPLTANVSVLETLASSSAPALVNTDTVLNPAREFEFDLYHIGRLRVTARRLGLVPVPLAPLSGLNISLFTPDGRTFAGANAGNLSVDIGPAALRLSRGPNGTVRRWKLRAQAADSHRYRLHAQVNETIREPRSVLLSRLHALLGAAGENVTIRGNWNNQAQTNVVTLTLNDRRLAETFGIHGVLGHLDRSLNPGVDVLDPEVGRPYVLKSDPLVLETGFFRKQAKLRNLKSERIQIEMGPSVERRALKLEKVKPATSSVPAQYHLVPTGEVMLPAGLPSFGITIKMSGTIKIEVDHWDDAELVVPGLRIEVGLQASAAGRIVARVWVDPDSVTFGGSEGSGHHPFRNDANQLKNKVAALAKDLSVLTGIFEDVFDRMLGGVFKYTLTRWAGNAMEFEHVAGVEPERKPNPGYAPRGDFGIGVRPGGSPGHGPGIKNTWLSPNLSKIDHIVVLVMENRSFDHVLGYLSLGRQPINPNVNGLTSSIIQQFSTDGNRVRHLREAGFQANAAGLKTKLPLDVGHGVEDVLQQLQIQGGKPTMKGFAANFRAIHTAARFASTGCEPQDALGFYTDADLAMYGFLAREFAVCDNFFCSHPGPTLPNRMFTLTGDFQRDRNGEPRIHNAIDTTFFLSRDQTIFDFLAQRQVSWRVYESFPSVTMLRMFTRYAGDEVNIRDIKHLENDIRKGGLPSVTFIDPAMHDAPPNDDHPPSDMLHGQHLIRRIYQALRSNDKLWLKTLFVITYDEHGGLFDHVPPPIAEVLQDPKRVSAVVAEAPAVEGTLPDPGRRGVVRPLGLERIPGRFPAPPRHKPNVEIIYGPRVPTFLISPFVERGSVYKALTDHTSILKTILIRFCGGDRPFMSDRVHHAFDLGQQLTLSAPRQIQASPPDLPTLPDARRRTLRPPAVRMSKLKSDKADWHEFMQVLSSVVKPV